MQPAALSVAFPADAAGRRLAGAPPRSGACAVPAGTRRRHAAYLCHARVVAPHGKERRRVPGDSGQDAPGRASRPLAGAHTHHMEVPKNGTFGNDVPSAGQIQPKNGISLEAFMKACKLIPFFWSAPTQSGTVFKPRGSCLVRQAMVPSGNGADSVGAGGGQNPAPPWRVPRILRAVPPLGRSQVPFFRIPALPVDAGAAAPPPARASPRRPEPARAMRRPLGATKGRYRPERFHETLRNDAVPLRPCVGGRGGRAAGINGISPDNHN